MNWPATIANLLWVGSSLPAWRAFKRALTHPAEIQQHLLQALVSHNSASAYGRQHCFSEIKTYAEFARNVPLVDPDNLAPWIERIRGGEPQVLTSGIVTHLIPTSGSTGARKLIPFTAGLQKQFNHAIAPWIVDLARQCPGILSGPSYWSITPTTAVPQPETSAVPIGFADDASYLGGVKGRLVRAAMIAPDVSNCAANLDEFRNRTLLSLVRAGDLRLISVWHPSFLILLLDALPALWNRLLIQIERECIRRHRELEHADPNHPETIWPRFCVISCWGDGPAELALADLRCRFPNALVQPKGLLATEAFVTIPFARLHPVAVRSHFYEFLDEHGRARLVHELRDGEIYEVVVTTAGGLWRYRMGDRVQVDGFLHRTPSLRFIGRGGNCSDLFGEKLSEEFVANVFAESLAELEAYPKFILLAPEQADGGWHYTFFVEGTVRQNLAKRIESALSQNPHYAHCRALGQLDAVRVFEISSHGYETWAARLVAEGRRLGDLKPAALSKETGWSNFFAGNYADRVDASKFKLTGPHLF